MSKPAFMFQLTQVQLDYSRYDQGDQAIKYFIGDGYSFHTAAERECFIDGFVFGQDSKGGCDWDFVLIPEMIKNKKQFMLEFDSEDLYNEIVELHNKKDTRHV
jgi:hypothetical protein